MKAARIYAAGWYVNCPYCDTPQEDPADGSHLWEPKQLMAEAALACQSCGKRFKVPAKVRRL